jgi:hypothetical protein
MSLYYLNELCAYPWKTASLHGDLDLTLYLALHLPVVRRFGDWQYAQALRSSPAGKREWAPSILCIRLTLVQRARLPPHKLETGSRHNSTAPS